MTELRYAACAYVAPNASSNTDFAQSVHLPQHVPTPVWQARSLIVHAPSATAWWIALSLMPWQMQTIMDAYV